MCGFKSIFQSFDMERRQFELLFVQELALTSPSQRYVLGLVICWIQRTHPSLFTEYLDKYLPLSKFPGCLSEGFNLQFAVQTIMEPLAMNQTEVEIVNNVSQMQTEPDR